MREVPFDLVDLHVHLDDAVRTDDDLRAHRLHRAAREREQRPAAGWYVINLEMPSGVDERVTGVRQYDERRRHLWMNVAVDIDHAALRKRAGPRVALLVAAHVECPLAR